ncbi:MAG TPA: DUF4349 domain-containing protein [Blastocatellia bacterium]|nr:DUF4349 domain-containing protein [Blastocatellia bacterium]
MKGKLKTGFIYLAAGFLLLFLIRLGYGYLNPNAGHALYQAMIVDSRAFVGFSGKNYATEKFKAQAEGQLSYSVDQKYEKVASMVSRTSDFDRDESKVRSAVRDRHGLIEYEQSSGLQGHRRLELALGVVPTEFDSLVEQVKHIGELESVEVDKTDKTSEYKTLVAKKASLEKTRDSLLSLQGRTGSVDQSITLDYKLLELEQNLQELGVNLGEYSQENEFCTVKLTLSETRVAAAGIPFLHRVRVALAWSIVYYLLILATLLVAAILILVVATIAEKLKWVTLTPPLKA